MEKKDKKQRDIVLSQDNALTTARYKFDLIEKRALYSIIRNIRAQYIENENGRRDLFDDLIITIHEEELKKCGDNTKMQNIYDALKRLAVLAHRRCFASWYCHRIFLVLPRVW